MDGKAIEELSRHVAACRQCTLSTNTLAVPSSAATGKVRLMFVGDYCCDLSPGEKPFLFGEAEDRMLVNMVSALGLSMTDVYVTNCLKCQGPKAVSGGQEELVRCLPFLFREIAAIRPSVICAMGDCSAQAVLNSTKPVVRLRGTFHRYRYYDQYPIEVMVTFHPRFLLAHQELKRATWTDLQLIQKRFLLPGG